jgi:hypothetical protein
VESSLRILPGSNNEMKEITKVLKNRIMVGAVAVSAALVPLAGMTALTAGPAGAAKPKGITCTKATGKVNETTFSAKINLADCSGTTGGAGKTTGTEGATSGTVKWANAKSTTFSTVEGTGTLCPSGDIADETINGNVTADSTGSTGIGAAVSAEICVSSALKVSLAPGTNFVIAK